MPLWDAQSYDHFEAERARPSRDLIARIPLRAPARVLDLGCGSGLSTLELRRAYPQAEIVGVDLSPDMLAARARRLPGVRFIAADGANFDTRGFDLVFANALFHWVPDHLGVLARIAAALPEGGCLAVQMPDNEDEPSHRLMREIAGVGAGRREKIGAFAGYESALCPPRGHVDLWRTTYVHRLGTPDDVVKGVEGAGLRPFLDPLDADNRAPSSPPIARRWRAPIRCCRTACCCLRSRACSSSPRVVNESLAPSRHNGGQGLRRPMRSLFAFVALCAFLTEASAQDVGTLHPKPLPALADPGNPQNPAKQVFGRAMSPTEAQARSIGFYSRGCMSGAQALPLDGESWRVMRISRNRYWGHPETIGFLERFSKKAADAGVWPGILVGDISQPRGGPMLTGHASHQIGLDADIWLTPMPADLTPAQREDMSAVDMVRSDGLAVDPAHWSEERADIIRFAAQEPQVSMIFVNAAIKKALCEKHAGESWMNKVRPWGGHNYHFHVRLRCPAGQEGCQNQGPPPAGDGCDKSLAWWFSDEALHPRPSNKPPPKPLTLAQLPEACRSVAAEP